MAFFPRFGNLMVGLPSLRQFPTYMFDKRFRIPQMRNGSTYEGDGKTTVTILNKDEGDGIFIDAISEIGFRLNSGVLIVGPSLIFPRSVLQWNVATMDDINKESLVLLQLLNPKIDVLVVGYGNKSGATLELNKRILAFARKTNTTFESLPTEDACATFNFLNAERRSVVAALLPVSHLHIYNDDDYLTARLRKKHLFDMESGVF